ncbi:RIPOR family member 3 isoform X2 [Oryzias latipes]|uniref:RIPOR family member 3 isoform X2 n=1 Tax=Oryzias latipes TaxID=8090 RepID=UPI000CE1FE11|nr:RIPOR family member 3 isoform X2 [Oryzias latipes]
MSVKLRFDSPSEGGLLQRSRSFTGGFSSLTGRQRSLRTRVTSKGKTPKMQLYSARGPGAIWSLQPEKVDGVFKALREGLKEYLEVHQAEMELLSSQQRETKRNSRLAFLYDLEKEIRALERYIRRLEFHISKVEELYETYCIQWRLCQGAHNMKRAFSLSPSTRASRESLLELSRNHRTSLQDMSAIEAELEILLGELHIKMKGLIGFARLCPGDQYEVVVRLGRQRWRIRGRIVSDDSQSWDEEEIVFLPHIHHNFEIKVAEAKGLGWLLVGTVTCTSADFFVAKPQLMLVDITELGTIKLQLEVTWSPFDSTERFRPQSISRTSVSSRKSSIYSWTAPSTPSFTEKYFMSMVRELQDEEGSLPSLLPKGHHSRGGVSLLSYLSNPPHGPQTPRKLSLSSSNTEPTGLAGSSPHLLLGDGTELKMTEGVGSKEGEEHQTTSPVTSQSGNTPDLLRKGGGGGGADPERTTLHQETQQESLACQVYSLPCTHPSASAASGTPGRLAVGRVQRRAQALRLGVLIRELEKSMQSQSCSDKELKALDHQILHLATILKNDLSLLRSSSSEETLAVEEVLGNFDFLSDDFNEDGSTSCVGSLRLKDSGFGSSQHTPLRSLGLLSQDSSFASDEEPAVAPLTCGDWGLDQALETHLDICCILLQMMETTDFSLSRRELLEEMAHQAEVLDRVSRLLLEKSGNITTGDILPEAQRRRDVLLFWEDCVSDSSSQFCCPADNFSRTLKKRYSHKVKARQPGQSEREYFLSALLGPKRRRALTKLQRRSIAELLPLGSTLQTLAALQIDANPKVCKAASSYICRAATCKSFRSKAVFFYTENLKSSDVHIQQASCLALKCLQATESVDYIADLWRSASEDLRCAARETVVSFGKKGHKVFEKMDQLFVEMEEEAFQNQETEVTIL